MQENRTVDFGAAQGPRSKPDRRRIARARVLASSRGTLAHMDVLVSLISRVSDAAGILVALAGVVIGAQWLFLRVELWIVERIEARAKKIAGS